MASRPLIYVQQFGGFWRLSEAEWRGVLASGIAGEGHVLPERGMLRSRPRGIHRDADGPGYWTSRNDILFHQPLDWEPDDYREALEELEARLGAR